MKILTVVGARPQFVKAAVFSRLVEQSSDVQEILVHTGQHFDGNMSQVFFDEMMIPKPNYNLEIGGGLHGEMTGRMLIGLEPIALEEKPDLMLVYGDTNSTLAGALVAAKLHIPLAHVEAGLRSFNKTMPEEINRILTDRVSDWLFCPTSVSEKNLLNEGVEKDKIYTVGDIMYDATVFYRENLKPSAETVRFVESVDNFVLCTIHRAENTDDLHRLRSIFSALQEISLTSQVFLPLHPRTRKRIESEGIATGNIIIETPVGYADMLYLLNHCRNVLTDSGGLQKEAYFFSKPCLTLRDETEWVETIESGVNRLVGSDASRILDGFASIQGRDIEFPKNLYGTGNAGRLILETLTTHR